jgi:hypothetical protein
MGLRARCPFDDSGENECGGVLFCRPINTRLLSTWCILASGNLSRELSPESPEPCLDRRVGPAPPRLGLSLESELEPSPSKG